MSVRISSSGGGGGVSSGWTDDGTVVRLTTSTDYVGIGTASPRGPTDINQPTLSVGNAVLNPIVFNYGSGSNYTNDNNHFGYTLYAKKVSGADTVYSAVGSSQIAVDNGGGGVNYTITLSWSTVSGATGYKIVVDNDEWYGAAGDYIIDTAATSVTIDGGNIYSGESPPIITPTTVGPDFYFDATGNIFFTNGAFKINGSVGTSPGGSSVPVGSIIQPGNVLTMETNTDAYAGVGGGVRLTLVNEDYHNGALFTNKSLDLVDFQFNGVTNPSSHFLTIRWEGRNAYNRNSANNSQGELQLGSTTAGDGIPAFCTGDGATILARGLFGCRTASPTAYLHIGAGTTAASTTPLKFTSGSLQTSAEAGANEFLTDLYYRTITTGTRRGVSPVYLTGRSAAQTAAVASVVTFTPPADSTFLVSANVLVITATAHSFTVIVTYTDEGGTSRTSTMPFSVLAGTFVTAITNVGGSVPYEGMPIQIRAKASTAITVATTGTFTTVTYNVEAAITQIA